MMPEHDEPGESAGGPWVCVVNPFTIGDTVLMVPMLRALRDRYLGAQLHLVTPSPAAPLLLKAGEVDVYRPDPRLSRNPPPLGEKLPGGMNEAGTSAYEASRWPQEVARWRTLGRPLCIAAMITTQDVEWERTDYLGIPLTYYADWPNGAHIARLVRDTIAEGPWDPTAYRLTLPGTGHTTRGKTVYLIPGASLHLKRWPADQFKRLGEHLTAEGYTAVMVLAEEYRFMLDLMGWQGPAIIGEPLVQLGRRFVSARLVVGNDTGITHLAGLMGAPTLALLFAPYYKPEEWHPLGPRVATVSPDPPEVGNWLQRTLSEVFAMEHLELASVVAATDALLARTEKELNHAA